MSVVARLNAAESLADRILKVDHAGEHGAVNIYRGQIFICQIWHRDLLAELHDFQAHEKRHRDIFAEQLRKRGIRRCRSYHLCGVGGLLLGIATALCGKAAVAATTMAVERVVLRHLRDQMEYLGNVDSEALRAIASIVDDEQTHHDRSAMIAAEGSFWPRVLRSSRHQQKSSYGLECGSSALARHVQWL